MKKDTVKFYSIIENLLPEYVRVEFPLVIEFLTQYYKSQENKSSALDIIRNIDKYVQIDNITELSFSTNLTYPVQIFDNEIFISSSKDLPDNYGLVKINNEIILYERLIKHTLDTAEFDILVNTNIVNSPTINFDWIGKILIVKDSDNNIINTCKILSIETGLDIILDRPPIPNEEIKGYSNTNRYSCEINGNKLINCTRGFTATTSYQSDTNLDELLQEETTAESHRVFSQVNNLSIIFLKEFFKKLKYQIAPGFEDEEFYDQINESVFIKNLKQFYSSKGTNCSFEILFKSLFGEEVNIILPRDYLIQPSDAQYNSFRDLVVESLEGNPEDLTNLTLYQDEYLNIPSARGTISRVEKIQRAGNFYYKISLDQSKENTYGELFGKFSIHPKTKTTIDIITGIDFIDVDSTIGFPDSGELEIQTRSLQKIIVSYKSKTSTQFLDCSGITDDILINTNVRLNTFAYGNIGDSIVKVSVTGVLSSLNIESYPYYSNVDEKILIETLGSNVNDIRCDNWFYNLATKYNVKSIRLIDNSDFTYELTLYDKNILKIGDSVSLLYTDGQIINGVITGISNLNTFIVVGFGEINTRLKYQIRRNILKVNSLNYKDLSKYSTNVQNLYLDKDNKIFVNSQSLPNYLFEPLLITDRSVSFSGSYTNSEIITISSHGFYTGDEVVYYSQDENNSLNIKKGIYFVYVVDNNNIKLALSRENIYTNNFVKVTGNIIDNKLIFEYFTTSQLEQKKLLPQNIFREISEPSIPKDKSELITNPGTTGIFVNGVELLNYKSKDILHYGQIEEIFVTSSGEGYDVVNPPSLLIEDQNGSGAVGNVSLKGSLSRVDILDPGFDYIETPRILIKGGNGKDAQLSVNLVSVDHFEYFNSNTGVDISNDIIGFSTYHKFRNNEVVYYDPQNQTKISGLSTNSQYYVSVVDPSSVKLHINLQDSILGINTVNLLGIGTGRHYLKSILKKKQVGSIQVVNAGSGYENKKRIANSSGINTYSDSIFVENHNYLSGEIVVYNSTGTDIGGLTSGNSYYVTSVNKNEFKLSNISLNNGSKDIFYQQKNYINLETVGSGEHIFNYEPITLEIIGKTGIEPTYSNPVNIKPIFAGEITSVNLSNKGNSYGSEIINHNKEPNISLLTGKNAQAIPVIKNGKIVEVIITNSGSDYYSTPKINILGKGSGAVLTPIIENNTLKQVKVLYGGSGYDSQTLINVVSSGNGAKFSTKIKTWRFDLFERLLRTNNIPPDDGVLYEGKNDKNGLEYTHLYAPRKLRESVLGTRSLNGRLVYNPDLELINGSESNSLTHSPIIGWAYDGNPIYGPYGYSSITGGSVKQMIPGYELLTELNNRPQYPIGTFIEDYKFTDSGDLDEHNGRFCVTPDFPNGVYAYFCTIDNGLPQSSGPFLNYKQPKFPYVIGNYYKSLPINFNFLSTSNLNRFNLNESSLLRNTEPYGLLNKDTFYDQLTDPNKIKQQISRIKSVSSGKVDEIKILNGGNFYNIGDKIKLSDRKITAFVSEIEGKPVKTISVGSTTIFDVEFNNDNGSYVGISTLPHGLLTNDLVTITSSYDYNISGKIIVNQNILRLRSGIESSSVTGIVTFINISGSLSPSKIRENDFYLLGNNEVIKILNIDNQNLRLRILRNQNGTTGVSSIGNGSILTEIPRKFNINFGITTSYNFVSNKEIYFDPEYSVGLGLTSGVGISSTLFLSIENFQHPVSIGTGSVTTLYFNDIKDLNSYSTGGYINLENSTDPLFNLQRQKIVSIGLTSIGIDYDSSLLSGIGVTSYLTKWNIKTIPTRSIYIPNHNLNTGDKIIYSSNGGNSIGVSTNGNDFFDISDNQEIYVYKISEELIGISTVIVGVGSTGRISGITSSTNYAEILYFNSVGTGNIHSFKTNYDNIFLADVSKNIVTVETTERHGIGRNDIINISVSSGISTSIKIKYNKKHRRLLVDPFDFSPTDVDLLDNSIRIINHGLKTGQKVIHTSSSPINELDDDEIYYIIVVSGSKIKLSKTYYGSIKSNPDYINFTTTSFGTLSKINPELTITKNSSVIFDLSDSSLSFSNNNNNYPSFKLEFYTDQTFFNKYETSGKTQFFDVRRIGTVGVSSDASVILNTENLPNILYYNLVPVNLKINNLENLEIVSDFEVSNNNKILIKNSSYNGEYSVVGSSATTFTFDILNIPESTYYSSESNSINYFVKSSSANGSISKIDLISPENNLKSLPSIIDNGGKGAILYAEGKQIGKVSENNIEILDIGFDYPSDFSIRPTAKFPVLLEIESFSTIKDIFTIYPGRNYSVKPDLILFDTYYKKLIDDVVLDYDIQSGTVNIIRNSNKISGDYIPKLISVNNTNGVGISSISYNSSTKKVTVELSKSYSNSSEFPFRVSDFVFIENVNVGISSNLRGYNSSEYEYSFFRVTDIDPNIGGSGATIEYTMEGFVSDGEILGTYDLSNSVGRIINSKDLPLFDVITSKKTFFKDEQIKTDKSSGVVQYHSTDRNIIKVSTKDLFHVGDIIRGTSSQTVAKIINVEEFKLSYNISESSVVKKGWSKETGFLNSSFQRLHDSDYYQYFSYSVQSKVEFNKWDESVSKLTHTSGFKKFSDLIVESNPKNSGMSKNQNESYISGIADIYGLVNLNCYYDFDLVSENNVNIESKIGSNQITFNSKILQDYIESIGNRVLLIDDISKEFNSNPRPTRFSIVDSFNISSKYKKYFFSIKDNIFFDNVEVGLISLLNDGVFGYLNQYAFVPTKDHLGMFDFSITSSEGKLEFYPNKFREDFYLVNLLSISLTDIASGIGSTEIGSSINLVSNYSQIDTSISNEIIGISSEYTSSKVLVQIGSTTGDYYEINELNLLNTGNDVSFIEYGNINTNSLVSISGENISKFNVVNSDGNLSLQLLPITEDYEFLDVNVFAISIGNTSLSGIDTQTYSNGSINSKVVSISSSPTPTESVISSFSILSYGAYYLLSIEDLSNNESQFSEVIICRNESESNIIEFGVVESNTNLGTFSTDILGSECRLLFTPVPNIEVQVRACEFLISELDNNLPRELDLNNGVSIQFSNGEYSGTELDIRRSFEITHKNNPVFKKVFSANSTNVVDVENDTIEIPSHFFVTGEEVEYSYTGSNISTLNSIGIATTSIPGIGITDKLPDSLYIIKVDDVRVKVSASASEALLTIPSPLDITSVGIGTNHVFTSKKQNTKCLVSIDNNIQVPVVGSSVTTGLSTSLSSTSNFIKVISPNNFYGGDFIKINDEIMKIRSVGFGSTDQLLVQRALLGTTPKKHDELDTITKVSGNYNIVGNTIHFSEPPFGKIPFSNVNNRWDEVDYFNIETSSRFNGRVFIRSGIENSLDETYNKNYLFDDISSNFTGISTEFTLTSEFSNITGITTSNAIVLINNIFQTPRKMTGNIESNQYVLEENIGVTSITFSGNIDSDYNYDINLTQLPRGGIILSVASSEGFGYQPLVSAAGTAIVSTAGTIQSISIGNSGSGYRSGIQTTINVGVFTSTYDTLDIHFIGTATLNNGNVVGVSITNPGVGYTSTNPPKVIFDSPWSYYNIPLVYSSISSGIGTGASINLIVGQNTNIIDFEITNYGFGYSIGDILTVETGGSVGIPTNLSSSFSEFQLIVDSVYSDSFYGWTVGSLQVLDSVNDLIDGQRVLFPIKLDGNQISLRSRKGSNIDLQSNLLIFVNDILQVPGEGYIFSGGSIIQMTEAPKINDDVKILFYRGTGDIDTKDVDILEEVEVGDTINLKQTKTSLSQNDRLIEEIISSDIVNTNAYFNVGVSSDLILKKSINLCKQTEDRFVNGSYISKSRIMYEPLIFPSTNIIENVSTSSTQFFVENVKTFFDSGREYVNNNVDNIPQKFIRILSQDNIAVSIATAIVSSAGTISSIIIEDGGVGYNTSPSVIIQNPIGIGSTATALASISIGGTISSIVIENPGSGYTNTNPPIVIIDSPSFAYEDIENVSYEGDFGSIVGISTTSIVGIAETGLILDLFVSPDSYLRDTSINSSFISTSVSGIKTGYLFVVNNTNIGNGVTSLNYNGDIVGIGSTFLDNIYFATQVSVAQTSVPGFGVTYVSRVVVSLDDYNGISNVGYNNFFGNYSWGLLKDFIRKNPKNFSASFNSYEDKISASVIRSNPLKYIGYSTT